MTTKAPKLDSAFIEKQRLQLVKLRASLVASEEGEEADEASVRSESAGTPQEYEDDAQKLTALELNGNLVVRDVERLGRIDRALQKIEEGTYGVSDASGAPIPRARLEAIPEANTTVGEAEKREQAPRP